MYGWTSWHQGRPDQKTQVCDSPRMAWNGGRGETEWPISPAGNPFLPREALQMLIRTVKLFVWCLSFIFCMLYFYSTCWPCFTYVTQTQGKTSGRVPQSVCFVQTWLQKLTRIFLSGDDALFKISLRQMVDISTTKSLILWGGILVIRIGFLSSKWWFWLSSDCNLINCYFYQQPLYNHMLAGG